MRSLSCPPRSQTWNFTFLWVTSSTFEPTVGCVSITSFSARLVGRQARRSGITRRAE